MMVGMLKNRNFSLSNNIALKEVHPYDTSRRKTGPSQADIEALGKMKKPYSSVIDDNRLFKFTSGGQVTELSGE